MDALTSQIAEILKIRDCPAVHRLLLDCWAVAYERGEAEGLLWAANVRRGVAWHRVAVGSGPFESRDARRARFERDRALLPGCADQFARSVAWIATQKRRQSPDPKASSYHYKHVVERHFSLAAGYTGDAYVCNGAFIAAAIASGLVWAVTNSPNTTHNISRKGDRA